MPGRVIRGPLTDANIALGYTGGPIALLDTRAGNGGSVTVDAIDVRVELPLTLFDGRLRFYVDATYQMQNTARQLFGHDSERAGHVNGPLSWRANGGFNWTRGDFTIGANA